MNEELLSKAMALFDTPEKWNAFCELLNRRDDIQNRWWRKLQQEVYRRELTTNNPDWDIYIWNNWDIRWYLKEFGQNSLCVHFWGDAFRVFLNYGNLDISKCKELLKDSKFDAIRNCFDRIDYSNDETIGQADRNFSFGTIYDGKFPDARTLSWYAGNRTEEFADQLIAKVWKFQTTEITALFKEINEKCKKE
ncbi:MAG: hypothetical protein LBN93_09360 [Candidatus Symbiothrix sp.]|jgi:hypothetical protein|nr:hypothetical protein [Candidatus Symbiothrix sp.]